MGVSMNKVLKNRIFVVLPLLFAATHLAAAEQKAKADPAKAKTVVTQVCAACHGADGNSTMAANPILAGQFPDYLYKQLRNFKSTDGKPAERSSAVMAGMVANLS